MANGNIVKCDKAFKLGTQTITEDFLVLIVTTVILGNPFFVKHKVSICQGQSYIKLNDHSARNQALKTTQNGS